MKSVSHRLKVGELAKRTGVSVRSLHHYDKIGLLQPSAHSESGHRLYHEEHVERLQQIISLKDVGFSLEQIFECLYRQKPALVDVLSMQKEAVSAKIKGLQRVERTLDFLLQKLARHQHLTIEETLKLISEIMNMEKIYTPEQVEKLQERLKKYPEEAKRVEQEWPVLFGQFEDAMKKGLSSQSKEVQLLAAKAQHFIDLFTGGDREIEANLDRAYEQNQESALKVWGVKKEVFEYATKARMIFNKRTS